MSRTPRDRTRTKPLHCGPERRRTPGDLHLVAAYEVTVRTRFVELLAHDAAALGALVTVKALLEEPLYETHRVEHEVFSQLPAAVGKAIGEMFRL